MNKISFAPDLKPSDVDKIYFHKMIKDAITVTNVTNYNVSFKYISGEYISNMEYSSTHGYFTDIFYEPSQKELDEFIIKSIIE